MPQQGRSASPRKNHHAIPACRRNPLGGFVLAVNFRSWPKAQYLPDNRAIPPPPRSKTSTRESPPHKPGNCRHAPPVPPILRPNHPKIYVRDRCKKCSLATCFRSPRSRQHAAQIFLCLKKCVLGSRFADVQRRRDFRVPESFHLIQQKYIALVLCQLRQRTFQSHPKGRVRTRCARLRPRNGSVHIILHLFFAPHSAPPQVMACVHEYPERPGYECGLPSKTSYTPLDFQECVLHGVFCVCL